MVVASFVASATSIVAAGRTDDDMQDSNSIRKPATEPNNENSASDDHGRRERLHNHCL